VPEDAVLQELTAGRLRALRVGGHVRIRESDFNSYLNASLEAPDANEGTSAAPATATKKRHLLELRPAPSFDHRWPAKKGAVKTTEHFTNAREGIVSDGGRERHVKIGFTLRTSAGKRRLWCLILDNRSLNTDTFDPFYVLMGHALSKEAQPPPVQRAGFAQAGVH